MFNLRLPPVLLTILVSGPALVAGRLAAQADYQRAGYVALLELFVISIASAIAAQRKLD